MDDFRGFRFFLTALLREIQIKTQIVFSDSLYENDYISALKLLTINMDNTRMTTLWSYGDVRPIPFLFQFMFLFG